ncbi:NAD-dependent epimerase/dehydratase family protein [Rossellomorea marisflavi]|uniref:NAD-dependent epimerase/dehydratase domain-containing protein n=1 Tax=Rossellomorea marisflavi TaxID=189381 RepID=A0A161TAR9_9BACI|nr:NAD(P)-dependent oxidoreductase [Rossellomorea marisflavi]KML33604.1 hypothetical protein VL12_07975 [Rossellomorea marisflavi]KZE50833.1 hypothetical protein AV649_15745 [Rossellomorea marisflavi]
MRKVVMVGGAGTVGKVLHDGLSDRYEMVTLDQEVPEWVENGVKVDATDEAELKRSIPEDTDILINLLTVSGEKDLKDTDEFMKMTRVHFISSFYLMRAAVELGIQKVIFASSNHTTDAYEEGGDSLLGREITVEDKPRSKGLYGVLKYASEQISEIISREEPGGPAVFNIRIGSVHADEEKDVQEDPRLMKTLLSHEDLVGLFEKAMESSRAGGTYYGVSDNPGKPWSIDNARSELGYEPKRNAEQVVRREGGQ